MVTLTRAVHVLMGKGTLIDESESRECGEYLYYHFFCEFEIILKVFKTGSDKKESKDGMYRQHSGTRMWSWSKGKRCVWLRKGFLLKGRDITVCRIVMVVVLKPSL